jgi:hypothetical protein
MWIRKAKNLKELPIWQRTMALRKLSSVSPNMSKAVHLVKRKRHREVDAEPTPVHDVNNMETLLIEAARAGQLEEI